jgi:hypothetical protein
MATSTDAAPFAAMCSALLLVDVLHHVVLCIDRSVIAVMCVDVDESSSMSEVQ